MYFNNKYNINRTLVRLSDEEKRIIGRNGTESIHIIKREIKNIIRNQWERNENIKKEIEDIIGILRDLTVKPEKFKINIGDKIKIGTYHDSPIEWIVLDKQNQKALLLSKYCLLRKKYNEKLEPVTWETCTLRKWLNQDFFQMAFTEKEKNCIEMISVRNPDNPLFNTKGGDDTKDRIFLLSIDEAKNYFSSYKERKATMTDWPSAWWWLRSPGYYDYFAAYVLDSGDVNWGGYGVDCGFRAVRPALWVNLDSDLF